MENCCIQCRTFEDENMVCGATDCWCHHTSTSGELKKLSFWDGLLEAEKTSLRFFVEQAILEEKERAIEEKNEAIEGLNEAWQKTIAEERTKLVGLVEGLRRESGEILPITELHSGDYLQGEFNGHNGALDKLLALLKPHE